MKNGWTLVETLVVIGILGLFAAIVIPAINKAKQISSIETKVTDSINNEWKVVTIEACEYILCQVSDSYRIPIHKGNCTNSIHSYKGQ